MKKQMIMLAVMGFFSLLLSAAEQETAAPEQTECFVKERIYKEEVPWDKYHSPQFVEIEKDGIIKFTVKRSGGPIGAMVKYFVKIDQNTPGPITVSAEGRYNGPKAKDGYGYRMGVALFYQGGGHNGENYIYFPAVADGKWHEIQKTFNLKVPVREAHIHVSLCYRDGVAEFRNISVKTGKATLKLFKDPAPAAEK